MEPGNLESLFKKVRTIAHGSHGDLLGKLIDMLFEREQRALRSGGRQSSNLAAIRAGERAIGKQAGQVDEHQDRP
jgi:hypothetical protein